MFGLRVQYLSKGIVPYNMKRIYQRLRWNIILWGFVFINENVMRVFPHFNPITLRK